MMTVVFLSVIIAIPFRKYPATRLLFAVVFGACVSVLVMDGFLDKRYPPSWSLQGVVYACNCLASIFAVFTYWPTPRTPTYLPGVLAVWISLLIPQLVMGQVGFYNSMSPQILVSQRVMLISNYAVWSIFLALFVKYSVPAVPNAAGASRREKKLRAVSSATTDDSWRIMRTAGNVCAVAGFVLSVVVNLLYLNGHVISVVVLSPLLVLLSSGTALLPTLRADNRYFPVVAAASVTLTVLAVYDIGASFFAGFWEYSWLYLFRNVFFLACTIPSHILLFRLIRDAQRQSQMMWIAIGPLNVLSLFSEPPTIKLLGVIGIIGSIAQYFIARSLTAKADKYGI